MKEPMVVWVFIDAESAERGTSEAFATQADAEAWFGTAWESLSADGTTNVALRDLGTGDELYRMSLAAE
ncbi:MAG: hypothetical protein ACXWH5_10225 [Actinomycetota bacterium]